MKRKLTAKEALDDYHFRLGVQAKLGVSMNTITTALRGKPTRIKGLRKRVLEELAASGVNLRTIGNGHGE